MENEKYAIALYIDGIKLGYYTRGINHDYRMIRFSWELNDASLPGKCMWGGKFKKYESISSAHRILNKLNKIKNGNQAFQLLASKTPNWSDQYWYMFNNSDRMFTTDKEPMNPALDNGIICSSMSPGYRFLDNINIIQFQIEKV